MYLPDAGILLRLLELSAPPVSSRESSVFSETLTTDTYLEAAEPISSRGLPGASEFEPGFAFVSSAGRRDPQTDLAQRRCDLGRFSALLDMRRIIAGHRAGKPVFRTVSVDPFPDFFRIGPLYRGEVDGAAVTITAGAATPAVQGVATARLETGGEALAIIVAERAEHRPVKAVGVHRPAGIVELFPEARVHAADHVILQRQAHALGSGGVLPGEVAARILFDGRTLVHLPQVIVDVIEHDHAAFATHLRLGAFRLRRLPGWESNEGADLDQRTLDRLACRSGDGQRRFGIDEANRLNRARIVRAGFISLVGNLASLHARRRRRRPTIDDRLVSPGFITGDGGLRVLIIHDGQRDHSCGQRAGEELEPEQRVRQDRAQCDG